MAKQIKVFVYGSLKSGQCNNSALVGTKLLGRATITGPYKFVDLSWYPGVVQLAAESDSREIGGEVWAVDPDTLATLDMIEGHPEYYRRIKVQTSIGHEAWCYVLPSEYGPQRKEIETLFWRENEEEGEWANARSA